MTGLMTRIRNLGNWCNLSTPLGLAVAASGRARVRRGPDGLWLAEGYRLPFPVAGAFTIGSVIVTAAPSWDDLAARRPGLLDHEVHHTWQWAYSLGLPYLPLYALSMGWSWLRTGTRASANVFERAAGLERGGYRRAETRPLRERLQELRTALSRAGSGGSRSGRAGGSRAGGAGA